MKQSEAMKLMAVVQAGYPRQSWPDSTISLFADEFARLPIDYARGAAAIRRMLRERTSEFAPPLGEILRALAVDADQVPSFDRAWGEMSALSSAGDYFQPDDPPAFSHPVIRRLALALGWRNFRMSNTDDQFLRRTAERMYERIVDERVGALIEDPAAIAALHKAHELPAPMRELVAGIGGEE